MSESKKEYKHVLTNHDITMLGIRSSLLQASFSYERMQSGGWLLAQLPYLEKIYGDDKEGLAASMTDNLEFINTHPNLVGFLMGLLVSMEEQHEDRSTIKGLKLALFGPIAGIGDAIFWFTLLPIVAGISSSFAAQGLIIGPIIFFSVYLVIWLLRITWTHAGYNLGVKAFEKLQENSDIIANSATILGITVVGAMIASYVSINLLPVINVGDSISVSIQTAFFDTIFPKLLPMCYTLLMYYYLTKKQANPVVLIVVTIAIALVCSAIGLL
jgi:PTS system galactosamine-specific IID component